MKLNLHFFAHPQSFPGRFVIANVKRTKNGPHILISVLVFPRAINAIYVLETFRSRAWYLSLSSWWCVLFPLSFFAVCAHKITLRFRFTGHSLRSREKDFSYASAQDLLFRQMSNLCERHEIIWHRSRIFSFPCSYSHWQLAAAVKISSSFSNQRCRANLYRICLCSCEIQSSRECVTPNGLTRVLVSHFRINYVHAMLLRHTVSFFIHSHIWFSFEYLLLRLSHQKLLDWRRSMGRAAFKFTAGLQRHQLVLAREHHHSMLSKHMTHTLNIKREFV
jgi:hypothetical protein